MKRRIITIVNNIGPTSMPLNEFVLPRSKEIVDERHTIVALGPVENHKLEYCKNHFKEWNVELFDCNKNILRMRKTLFSLLARCKTMKEYPLFHIHHPKAGTLFHLIKNGGLRQIPVIYTVHNTYGRYKKPSRAIVRYNISRADAVSFVSNSSYRSFPKKIISRKGKNAFPIQNGVDVGFIDSAIQINKKSTKIARDEDTFRLVTASRLVDVKNHEFMIQLISKLPDDYTLKIIGSGPREDALRRYADSLSLNDRITFTGFLATRTDVYAQVQSCDAFISSSTWEGLPIAVLEAMAIRMPVVVSNIPPHREISEKGESVIVESLDLAQWEGTIRRMRSLAPPERLNIGESNRRIVEEYFSLSRMHKLYSDTYKKFMRPDSGNAAFS